MNAWSWIMILMSRELIVILSGPLILMRNVMMNESRANRRFSKFLIRVLTHLRDYNLLKWLLLMINYLLLIIFFFVLKIMIAFSFIIIIIYLFILSTNVIYYSSIMMNVHVYHWVVLRHINVKVLNWSTFPSLEGIDVFQWSV
jgi:hypothetical protein